MAFTIKVSGMTVVALGALWTLLASFAGNALVERMEKHAVEIVCPSARWRTHACVLRARPRIFALD